MNVDLHHFSTLLMDQISHRRQLITTTLKPYNTTQKESR